MNPLLIFWAISSAIAGAGFTVAAWNLRPALKITGTLIPFVFCLANGLYEIIFAVSILLASSRLPGSSNFDVIILWLVFYIPARVSGIILALLLSGQISDGNLRHVLESLRDKFTFHRKG